MVANVKALSDWVMNIYAVYQSVLIPIVMRSNLAHDSTWDVKAF